LIGNLIIWFIGFAIVAMSARDKRNAIENAAAYIGKYGTKSVALISIIGFSTWYFLQIQATTIPINHSLYGNNPSDELTTSIYGVCLGILISLFAFKNLIQLIKKTCTIFLPALICYHLYLLFSNRASFPTEMSFSLPCTSAYVSFLFAGAVNLPTFFRHARSKYDSYIALTIMTLINVFFQISTAWINSDVLTGALLKNSISDPWFFSLILKTSNIVFSIILLFCSNLVNIYFASPGWELFFPKIKKQHNFVIIGLFGTIIYALSRLFPQYYMLIKDTLNITDLFIANLGTVLLVIFGYRFVIRHRPKPFEKLFSSIAWFIGCGITVFATFKAPESPPLLTGTGATILFFLFFVFIEEPFWSIKKLRIWLNKKPISTDSNSPFQK
jgi:hypothetical protein